MKLRKVPLGYGITDGKIVVDEKELEIVRYIFSYYCKGMSLKALVENLNDRDVVFKENGVQWNKGRVHHILVDRRYIGENLYPQIIDTDIFNKANELRGDKSVTKKAMSMEIAYLKDKIYCGHCGNSFNRKFDNDGKERWSCTKGCRFGHRPTDEKLLTAINNITAKIAESPELLVTELIDIGYKPTTEIMRMTNEIARMNEQNTPSFSTGKTLLFQIAAKKFASCKEDKSIYTEILLGQIKGVIASGGVNADFIRQYINKVLIFGKNDYAVEFINGAIIKEESGNAGKTCN